MEQAIKILIYIHAFFGGLGLLTGLISVFVKKGGFYHKRTGKVFSYSMVISAFISLVVARMPNHENLFLFLIGIFTIYLVIAGNRALTFKNKAKTQVEIIDKLVSGTMLLASIIMLVIGVIKMVEYFENGILYTFFGGLGAFLTIKDFQKFRNFEEMRRTWLVAHLGRMIGALTASVTAFIVAGLNIETIVLWILPTIFGTIYIRYWKGQVKLNDKSKIVVEP